MVVWQAVELENDCIIFQSDSAKELAALLDVSPKAVYMSWYRRRKCSLKISGRNKKFYIEKVVIDND